MSESPIVNFYNGKSILITGGTGFIGKVLVEKLLYSSPRLSKIYLLIRRAKGKSSSDRLAEMIEQLPFSIRLKSDFIKSKLVAIDSDLIAPNLGLSDADCSLLAKTVSIVFHVAASVKFEAPLDVNIDHNVIATKQLLEIAKKFNQLDCFIHVSTAYSNCQFLDIDERVYPMNVPKDLKSIKLTPDLLQNRPNSYTFTKALAENVVVQYTDCMNIAIVRPSIVMSAMNEPAKGWVDSINGPVGLSVLGALGILQKIKVNSEVVFDLIPVDIVTNALVTIAWAVVKHKNQFSPGSAQISSLTPNEQDKQQQYHETQLVVEKDATTTEDSNSNLVSCNYTPVRVFNLTTGSENPCSFYQYFSTGREEAYRKPSARALRPLLAIPKQKGMNPIMYFIFKIFSHLLFGYIVDTILSILGHKKMIIKAVHRMHQANDMFDYFCSNQWQFTTENVKKARMLQEGTDKREFDFDVRAIDWDRYARIGWIGCRRFVLKEDDSTCEWAKLRYMILCAFYYSMKIILSIFCAIAARYLFSSPIALSAVLTPIYCIIYLL